MSTWIIKLWVPWSVPDPNTILGPYTKREAEHVAKKLNCGYTIRQISTVVPQWALA